MAIFLRHLDINGVNIQVLCQSFKNNPQTGKKKDFLKLAGQLEKHQLEKRAGNLRLKRDFETDNSRDIRKWYRTSRIGQKNLV